MGNKLVKFTMKLVDHVYEHNNCTKEQHHLHVVTETRACIRVRVPLRLSGIAMVLHGELTSICRCQPWLRTSKAWLLRCTAYLDNTVLQ